MQIIDIQAQRLGDMTPISPKFRKFEDLELYKVGILEHGMLDGRTSIALLLTDEKGVHYTVQIPADLWNSVNMQRISAEAHWRDTVNPYFSKPEL